MGEGWLQRGVRLLLRGAELGFCSRLGTVMIDAQDCHLEMSQCAPPPQVSLDLEEQYCLLVVWAGPWEVSKCPQQWHGSAVRLQPYCAL